MMSDRAAMVRSNDPAAWTATEIGGKEGLVHRVGSEHQAAMLALLEAIREVPVDAIELDSFSSPELSSLMAAVRHRILRGEGAVVLSGFDIAGLGVDEYERVYRWLGRHLGRLVAQSGKGDLVGRVRHATDSKARGYLTNMELGPHTDYHEILSLASFRRAHTGGLSAMTSALAVHNELLATRPDLLEALYEGYYNGIPIRYGVNDNAHAERKVPAFSSADGNVSAFTLSFWGDAAYHRGEEVPAKLTEAMRFMHGVAIRDDMQVRFMLEPGEMIFWSNRTIFHSRTYFENLPGQERMLLRLWIDVDGGRPAHPEVAASAEMVEHFHTLGLDQRESAAPGYA